MAHADRQLRCWGINRMRAQHVSGHLSSLRKVWATCFLGTSTKTTRNSELSGLAVVCLGFMYGGWLRGGFPVPHLSSKSGIARLPSITAWLQSSRSEHEDMGGVEHVPFHGHGRTTVLAGAYTVGRVAYAKD
jgi:hypothetical protein